jgi:hypothetical protein
MLEAAITDHTPAGLADLLEQMMRATLDVDREAAAVLASARDSMRALAWNRYAARKTRESKRCRFIRHHKSRTGYAPPQPLKR